jgi:hypothetical protein
MSTILKLQQTLFNSLDDRGNISSVLDSTGTVLTVTNITDRDFENITLVTNNSSYKGASMVMTGIQVFLVDSSNVINNTSTPVVGLLDIVKNRISDADTEAFINKQKTYQPFINGFKIGSPIKQHIHDIIDTLSTLVTSIPDTKPYSKLYKIVFKSK